MKNNNISIRYFLGIILSAVLVLVAACSADDELVNSSLKVSDTAFSFYSGGEDTFTVSVESLLEWNAEFFSQEGWLYEVERDAKSFTVRALPNTSAETRTGTITVTDGVQKIEIAVTQLGLVGIPNEDGQLPIYKSVGKSRIAPLLMSKNGKYAGGIENTYIGFEVGWAAVAVVWEVSTEKEVYRTQIPDNVARLYATNITSEGGMVAVSSFNHSFVLDGSGNLLTIEVPSGYVSANVENISDDGNVWVGFATNSAEVNYPVKWTNGVPQILALPSPDDRYTPTKSKGTHALGCSSDGSVIYGATVANAAGVYWDANGEFHFIGREILEEVPTLYGYYFFVVPEGMFSMSPNGRYLVSFFAHPVEVGNYAGTEEMPSIYYPAVLDTQTGLITLYKEYTGNDAYGLTITDEGLMSLANGRIINIHTGEVTNTNEWIKIKYGLDLGSPVMIERFCDDGETILARYNDGVISVWMYSFFYIYYPVG